ncbi:MAG: hypothetical protein H7Y00_01060 [Fimbriimonadaceae bacterium]|nr:hypothetical protein [Chitinophagales bacterium]
MKKHILVLIAAIAITATTFAQSNASASIKVSFAFKGIEDGYDHTNYCAVFIDGVKVGESSKQVESKKNSFKVKTTQGEHDVKIINYTEYQGNWEEHTIENTYSIDCMYAETMKLKKKNKIGLLFDLDSGIEVK